MEKMKKLLATKRDEIALLADVLTHDGDEVERLEEDFDDVTMKRGGPKAKKRMGAASFLSGGADRTCALVFLYSLYLLFYPSICIHILSDLEVRKKAPASSSQEPSAAPTPAEVRHPLFKKRNAK